MKKRLLVKLGTASLLSQRGKLSQAILNEIAHQIASLISEGWQVALVTSGAVQAGREFTDSQYLDDSEFFEGGIAAIGSVDLITMWKKAFGKRNIKTGLYWVTYANLRRRGEVARIKSGVESLMKMGSVALFNIQDSITDLEYRAMKSGISENDRLTRRLSPIIKPSAVLSITSIGGVFCEFPVTRATRMYQELDIKNLPSVLVESTEKTDVGSGGMSQKIIEFSGCCKSGRRAGIAGWQNNGIYRFANGELVGTLLGSENRFWE